MVKDTPVVASFKSWIFPGLVSILGMMIWNDVNEIKSDVKLLMAQSNVDKTRIDNLERQLFKAASTPTTPVREPIEYESLVAILPDNKYKTIKYDF
jgi:hypothetical protein